jgi:hypothetical protein
MLWIWKVFGSVIRIESGQICVSADNLCRCNLHSRRQSGNPLPNHLVQEEFGMVGRSYIFKTIFHGSDDPETVIDLSQLEKTNVYGDLGALEIYHNDPVKIRPDHLFPAFTPIEPFYNPDFLIFPPYII